MRQDRKQLERLEHDLAWLRTFVFELSKNQDPAHLDWVLFKSGHRYVSKDDFRSWLRGVQDGQKKTTVEV